MENEIFIKIMNLIEQNTDMPLMMLDIESWINKKEQNKKIYEIYMLASNAREMEEDLCLKEQN